MENQSQPVPPAPPAPVVPPPFVSQSVAPAAPSVRLLLSAAAALVVLGSGFWLLAPRAEKSGVAEVASTTAPAAAATTVDAAATATTTVAEKPAERATTTPPVNPVTDFPGLLGDDWLRGGSSPKVVLVVYTDLDCPFCRRLHARLDKIVSPYGGDVAWTLRHMPLSMHPDAFPKAVAAECVADRLGSAAFWGFVDAAFSGEKSSSELGASFGLSRADLTSCAEGRAGEAVLREMAAGSAAGATGTPYTVVMNRAGEKLAVSGAQEDAAFAAAIVKLKDSAAVSARE